MPINILAEERKIIPQPTNLEDIVWIKNFNFLKITNLFNRNTLPLGQWCTQRGKPGIYCPPPPRCIIKPLIWHYRNNSFKYINIYNTPFSSLKIPAYTSLLRATGFNCRVTRGDVESWRVLSLDKKKKVFFLYEPLL